MADDPANSSYAAHKAGVLVPAVHSSKQMAPVPPSGRGRLGSVAMATKPKRPDLALGA